MKKELSSIIEEHTIPAVVGGRDVLCMTSSQINGLIKSLESFIKKTHEPELDPHIESDVSEVISYINEEWGTKFRTKTEAGRKPIRARLRDGHSMEDLILVAKHLGSKWGRDPRMSPYLRPITVFSPSKFEGYLSQAKATEREYTLIRVKDGFGKIREITKAQYDRAEPGFFTRLEP
jgi:uncharacterized phage protein (TIGR02220 family)